jgi:hypothetical protein
MKKNKLKLLVMSAVVSTSLLFGSASAFAENNSNKDNANTKVEQAINNKTFYNYMMAYIDILNLPQDQQGELLNQLAPLWNDVNTAKVQKARTMLKNVAKNKDGKTYAETEAYLSGLSDSDMDAWTKGYLLGELTSWGRQFVFTDDYKSGVDSLINIGNEKSLDSYTKALATINNISNSASKEYLLGELANYKKTYNISQKDGVYDKSKVGNIKGAVTYQYNKVIGTKPDVGADIILIPRNLTDKMDSKFENFFTLVHSIDGKQGDYGIYTAKTNGYGNYEINNVPAGDYYLFILSNKVTSDGTINQVKQDVLNSIFSKIGIENLNFTLKSYKSEYDWVTVVEGQTSDKSVDFGYYYR